jgi:transcription antitermination factor NusG
MDVWIDTNWFAINTKPHREDAAAMNIARLGVEVLMPRIISTRFVLGTPRSIKGPLFPCYLFARFSPIEFLHAIRYARGVRKVVGAGDVPLPVDGGIISSIRSRLDEKGFIDLSPRRIAVGEEVSIQNGFLHGFRGIFERELSGQKRVVILLQSIEYQARVFVDRRFLAASQPETI